jgi:hypothetical protein
LLSEKHFTVDDTLLEAWASMTVRVRRMTTTLQNQEAGIPSIPHEWRSTQPNREEDDEARVSQRARKKVEEIFGWSKTVGGGHKLRFRGIGRNRLYAQLVASAYNLLRTAKLEVQPGLA